MYQLLQDEKQRLAIMWAQIAPLELTADVTPAEQDALESQWMNIAPHELCDYAALCLEQKAAFELTHNIPDFFAPSDEEMIAFESDYQKHIASYIIWK